MRCATFLDQSSLIPATAAGSPRYQSRPRRRTMRIENLSKLALATGVLNVGCSSSAPGALRAQSRRAVQNQRRKCCSVGARKDAQ